MKALTFQIRTLQPVLITRPGAGEENSATSYDYIPGSVLRGLLIIRYLQKNSIADAAGDSNCRRLFFDGTVVFLNAYPTHRLGGRTLPKPLSWMVGKEEQTVDGAIIHDFAVEPKEDEDSLVELKGTFCWRTQDDEDEPKVEIFETFKYVGIHNASEDRDVKRKGDSTVYRYEAIAPGQLFSGAILSDNVNDLQILKELLEEKTEAHIGGSRSAGYGLIRFEPPQIKEEWREYELDAKPGEGIVIITLLSDAILRDPQTGGFTTNLSAVLGLEHLRAFTRTRVVGGFNRKWGLPLIQAPALQAGSTFVYNASEVETSRLQQMVKEGLGERRVDGFGRIAVNWHTREELIRKIIQSASKLPTVTLSEPSQLLAKQMAERRLRKLLDRKLMEVLTTISISNQEAISTTQLSRLRQVILRAWQECSFQSIITHLNNLKKSARVQFERARVGNKRLSEWLREGIENGRLWQDHLQPQKEEIPSVAGIKAEITDPIRVEYTVRLLDALLQRTIKEIQRTKKEQPAEGGGV